MELLTQFSTLVGVAAFIGLLINVGKVAGIVKDTTAQNWSAGLNILGMIGLLALKLFKPELDVSVIVSAAGQIAAAGVVILGLLVQLGVSKITNFFVKGVPVIGKSFSLSAKLKK